MWTAYQLADTARSRPDEVAHLGLRTASPLVEDALALCATRGRLGAPELRGALDRGTTLERSVASPAAAAALALLWSARGPQDLLDAGARLYAWLTRAGSLPDVGRHHQGAAQALYLSGRTDELDELWSHLVRIPGSVRHDLEVDLAHPWLSAPGPGSPRSPIAPPEPSQAAHDRWVELLSARFVEHGLTPLAVSPVGPEPHLFDRLRSTATAGSTGGPLVTVIVPCWRPDDGLRTSLASLTEQTYADLEILVVDDASGPDYDTLFEEVTSQDPRVRLLRMDRNGGSYLARRAALQIARGELITTQDADDWSHPERIEQQVAVLRAHPQAPASRSSAIRARDDLTHQWFGYRAVRDNASSLMVRREVLGRAGTFWPIRKSADSEYAERLTRLLGTVVDSGSPLAITRLRDGSLSRGDFTYQWAHPDRNAFRGIYRAWHRSLATSVAPAPHDDSGTDRFVPDPPRDEDLPEVPPAFARGLDGTFVIPARIDVAVLADLSEPPSDTRHRATLDLLSRLARSSSSVALWHVEVPTATTLRRPEMHDDWFDHVLATPHLHVLTRTHPCAVGLVLVLDPSALLTASAQPTAVEAARVEVALSTDVTQPAAARLPTDLLGVSDACQTWWGQRPQWVVLEDGDAAVQVREELPGLPVRVGVAEGFR